MKLYYEDNFSEFYKLNVLDKYLLDTSWIIAGGCFKDLFLDRNIKDIDLFFRSEDDYIKGSQAFAFDSKVDLHHEMFENPEKILQSFDFTVSKCALYYSTDEYGRTRKTLMVHDCFFNHLENRLLVIDDALRDPIGTKERMSRYIGYGFKPESNSEIKLNEALGYDWLRPWIKIKRTY